MRAKSPKKGTYILRFIYDPSLLNMIDYIRYII